MFILFSLKCSLIFFQIEDSLSFTNSYKCHELLGILDIIYGLMSGLFSTGQCPNCLNSPGSFITSIWKLKIQSTERWSKLLKATQLRKVSSKWSCVTTYALNGYAEVILNLAGSPIKLNSILSAPGLKIYHFMYICLPVAFNPTPSSPWIPWRMESYFLFFFFVTFDLINAKCLLKVC